MELKKFEAMIEQIIANRGTCVVLDYNSHHVPALSAMKENGTFEESEWVSKEQKCRALSSGQIWTVSYDGGPDVDGYPSGVYLRGYSLPLILSEVLYRLGIPPMDDFLRTVSTLEDVLSNHLIGPKASINMAFCHTDKGMEPPAGSTEEWFKNCGVKETEFTSKEEYQLVLAAKKYWDINWFTGSNDFSLISAKASSTAALMEYIESLTASM